MATLNQCMFIGHLGKDPVLEVTSDGIPYTRFSLAVDQGKDRKGKTKKPLWLNITCWSDLAERMEKYLYKGAQVYVQGRLQESEPYTDKQGVLRQSLDIEAKNIQLLDKKADSPDDQEAPV